MSSKKKIAFFHANYPGQFGPIIRFLRDQYDAEITYFSEGKSAVPFADIRHIQYIPHDNRPFEEGYFFTRYVEAQARHMYSCYLMYENHMVEDADLLVGHVGFGNLMFFHQAKPQIPTVGFFEHFYKLQAQYRPEYQAPIENQLRVPLNNSTQLLELEYCTKGYSPTPFQRNTFPKVYQHKLATIFDGIDTHFYCPGEVGANSELKRTWPEGSKLITFVSRGLEAFRGFDIFMEAAFQVCQKRDDVHFLIAGKPKTHYGSEMIKIKAPSFKEFVLSQKPYDLSRFHFLDWISENALRDLFRLSDLHVYWTVPHTLSWSFMQAMSTGVLMMGSNTLPVQDVLVDGENGVMVEPHDVDAMVEAMLEALDNPQRYAHCRTAARDKMVAEYSFDVCLPQLADYYFSAIRDHQVPALSGHVL